jgi:hypothetical protein
MPGQALRLATLRGDDVDVGVAGVLAAERDPLAVGGEMRIRRLALEAGQAARHAARTLDRPDIVGIGEGDLRCADRRHPQQFGRPAVGRGPAGERRHDEGAGGAHREHPSRFLHAILHTAGDGTIFTSR